MIIIAQLAWTDREAMRTWSSLYFPVSRLEVETLWVQRAFNPTDIRRSGTQPLFREPGRHVQIFKPKSEWCMHDFEDSLCVLCHNMPTLRYLARIFLLKTGNHIVHLHESSSCQISPSLQVQFRHLKTIHPVGLPRCAVTKHRCSSLRRTPAQRQSADLSIYLGPQNSIGMTWIFWWIMAS